MSLYQHLHGTIVDDPYFSPEKTADELQNAMKGGDKTDIISILVRISNAQRQQLRTAYEGKYETDLIAKLKKSLSGDFEDVIVGLMETPARFDASCLHKAIKGLGTRESTLIDIITTRTPSELLAIRDEYERAFGVKLEKDVAGDTSGDFQQLLLAMLAGERDSTHYVDYDKARHDARLMAGNKKDKIDPDKSAFADVFSKSNVHQLQATCAEYQKLTALTIQKGIQKVFSGDAKDAYMHLLNAIESKPRLYVSQLVASMKGFGTNEAELTRIIISRSEIDLLAIMEEYLRTYQKRLSAAVKDETSGLYREALIRILYGNIDWNQY